MPRVTAMIDYHIHTYLCRHAEGTPEDYADIAIEKGLREIGFADHFPLSMMEVEPKTQVSMNGDEIESYFQMVNRVSRTKNISVKTGIELDYVPGKTVKLAKELHDYPFDYIIGSIHFMDDWDFTHPYYVGEFEQCSLADVYERYYSLVCEGCKSGLFDIIGHVDVIKKFDYRPEKRILMPYYTEVANVLSDTGVCLEINTSGLDAPVNEIYPARELLKLCISKGVKIVLGSDAHAAHQVGRYFPQAIELLKDLGVKETVVFEGRSGNLHPLKKG